MLSICRPALPNSSLHRRWISLLTGYARVVPPWRLVLGGRKGSRLLHLKIRRKLRAQREEGRRPGNKDGIPQQMKTNKMLSNPPHAVEITMNDRRTTDIHPSRFQRKPHTKRKRAWAWRETVIHSRVKGPERLRETRGIPNDKRTRERERKRERERERATPHKTM